MAKAKKTEETTEELREEAEAAAEPAAPGRDEPSTSTALQPPSVGRVVHVLGLDNHERTPLAGIVTAVDGTTINAAIFLPNGQVSGATGIQHIDSVESEKAEKEHGKRPKLRWQWPARV